MRYSTYNKAGELLANRTHGCWGYLQTAYRPSAGVDKIIYHVPHHPAETWSRIFGVTQEEFYLSILKGYDVSFRKSQDNVVDVIISNISDRSTQELMLRLFTLRGVVENGTYTTKWAELCKENGLTLLEAMVLNGGHHIANNGLAGKRVIGSEFTSGGNAIFWNTSVSDLRRYMKGDFRLRKDGKYASYTWGKDRGYTSGAGGRGVQESCSRAPLGSVLWKAFFMNLTTPVYRQSTINEQGRSEYYADMSTRQMEVDKFFELIKIIRNKKKLPTLPEKVYVAGGSKTYNPFVKTVQC